MNHSPTAFRLTALRKRMANFNIDYYLVPGTDPHRNEYVPEHWQRRQWISNFSGSAGDALIAMHEAYLWTDPRYFLQATMELDANCFKLIKLLPGGTPPLEQCLAQQKNNFCVAIDPQLISPAQVDVIKASIEKKQGKLILLEENLIDAIWEDQPPLPTTAIQLFDIDYAGQSLLEKTARVRQELQKNNCDALVINTLDSIAWLLNIRGNDIIYNPLVISYALLTQQTTLLFVDKKKLTPAIENYFSKNNISVQSPDTFKKSLESLQGRVWLDSNSCNAQIKQALGNATIHYQTSPISRLKAIKNATEQQGMRQAHILDAIAMIKFLYWLETHWEEGVTELSAAATLNDLRREHPDCLDLSFNTISGFAAHGAIVHYASSSQSNITIDDSSLYLVDSGGQYKMGTTDITRTIHLGKPTQDQKHHYTRVLKGHLNIRHLIFPDGTCGEHINALAHAPLWKDALDYGHGTGHGVGCYSCVHEFPPSISAHPTKEPLKPGMVVSNEPGLYITDHYGIRIENLCLIYEAYTVAESATGHGPFYGFEDLTLVPYAHKLIEKSLLTDEEINAIDYYHREIFTLLAPLLTDSALIAWLDENTRPI